MKTKLLNIINHYGVLPQLKYFQSEVYELTEAIIEYEQEQSLKDMLGIKMVDSDISKKEHIKEELADVLVMFEQFRLHYNISLEDIYKIGITEINRQTDRVKKEKEDEFNYFYIDDNNNSIIFIIGCFITNLV